MGWSLRQVAKEIGLAAPTLYAYFDNKHAIYDAMFKQSYERLDEIAADWTVDDHAVRASFKTFMHAWFEFCTTDSTRYQLMFQRTIPDFEPSDDAYVASLASYERFRGQLAAVGVTDDANLDLWTAISTGLTNQQISNNPGGNRWRRLVDTAVDLFCDHCGIPKDPTDQAEPDANGAPNS
jgi:AcrR family transcriptional regulator